MSITLNDVLADSSSNASPVRPYVGLRYFEENDASLFYGRDEHTAEILGKVARDRFVAILGSSGSGKSSLVRAGLLPELRSGMIPRAGPRWRVIEFRPGNAPLGELANAICSNLGLTNSKELLEEGPLGIVNAVKAAQLAANTNVLIIADQFEEVFRFQREERDRGRESDAVEQSQALVRKLLDAAAQFEIPIYVLLVMRSDYLGECSQFHELPERISGSMYLVPRLRRDQVQEVIASPIGNNIEAALIQELLGKAGTDSDQLPRLQHLLSRIWAIANGGRLTMQHYVDAGCWEEALAKNLDEVYDRPNVHRPACARLFQQLSDIDESNRVVRRRASLDDLIELCGPEITATLSEFQRDGFVRADNPVDITHECILRNWDKVKEWLREEIDARDFYREIRARQGRRAMLSGADLTIAQKYLASGHYTAAWAKRYGTLADFEAVRDFISGSAATEQKAKRRQRQLRYALIGLLTLFFAFLAISVRYLLSTNLTIRYKNEMLSVEALREKKAAESAQRAAQAAQEATANEAAAKHEAERQAELAQEGQLQARREQVLAASEAKRADSEKKRADDEAQKTVLLNADLQKLLAKDPAGRASQQTTASPASLETSKRSFSGRELARLYNFPPDLDGSGQTIALIELSGGFTSSDLDHYFKGLNLRIPKVTVAEIDSGKNRPGTPADSQVTGDIETAGAVAPGARIIVYFSPNTDQGFIDAISAATHSATSIVSIGWGSPEQSWTKQAVQGMNEALRFASSQGITVVAAAGNNGVTDGLSGLRAVDFPASSPWVLAVGGTQISTSGGDLHSETVWNDGDNGGATGGGVSTLFPAPEWQAGIVIHQNFAAGKLAGRAIPDVAADASPKSGYGLYVQGKQEQIGGTSLSAPFWAGAIALLNQGLGRNVGHLNPLLYQKLGPAGVFHGITQGNNSFGNVEGYSAGPGWNAVTGWGSPDGARLLKELKLILP